MPSIRILLASGLLIAASVLAIAPSQTEKGPIPDREIGLAAMSPFEVWTPPAAEPESSDPGEGGLQPAAHPEAPPVVPHNLSDYLPITRQENLCLDCHQIELEVVEEGDPVPLPPSHYVDLRGGSDEPSETVVGARWVCLSCHVGRTDAEPLVDNPFHTP